MPSDYTSFEPHDAATSMSTGGDPTVDNGAPKTATLTPDQLSAFGIDSAAPGSQYTINITVGDTSDTGTNVTVDSCEPGAGADASPGGDMAGADDTQAAMGDLPPAPLTPPKPKPTVRGPKSIFGKKM